MPTRSFVSHMRSGALLLVFDPFSNFFTLVGSVVCDVCFGAAHGCTGIHDACPWLAAVASNAAVVAAAAGGTIAVSSILPAKISNLFPKRVLDLLSSVVSRVKDGTIFDPTGKSPAEIVRAVRLSHCSPDDAVLALTELIAAIEDDDGEAATKIKKLRPCWPSSRAACMWREVTF